MDPELLKVKPAKVFEDMKQYFLNEIDEQKMSIVPNIYVSQNESANVNTPRN